VISLEVTDDDADVGTADVNTLVKNLPPVIESVASSSAGCGGAHESEQVTVMAQFTDVGTLDTHTATIDWNDGKPVQAETITEFNGSGTATATHAYASGGIYTATLTVIDDDSGQATDITFAVVSGVGLDPNGVLTVIGTDVADHVEINQTGDGSVRVHADFVSDLFRDFSTADVTEILVILCGGSDHATIAGDVDLPSLIDGGDGDDFSNAGRGPSLQLGGAGDDKLIGGAGRNVLIGGTGKDHLISQSDEDILVAGKTIFDLDSSAITPMAIDVLRSIRGEWASNKSLADRVANLSGSGSGGLDGLNYLINGSTVFNDGEEDFLNSGKDADWYLADPDEDKFISFKDGVDILALVDSIVI